MALDKRENRDKLIHNASEALKDNHENEHKEIMDFYRDKLEKVLQKGEDIDSLWETVQQEAQRKKNASAAQLANEPKEEAPTVQQPDAGNDPKQLRTAIIKENVENVEAPQPLKLLDTLGKVGRLEGKTVTRQEKHKQPNSTNKDAREKGVWRTVKYTIRKDGNGWYLENQHNKKRVAISEDIKLNIVGSFDQNETPEETKAVSLRINGIDYRAKVTGKKDASGRIEVEIVEGPKDRTNLVGQKRYIEPTKLKVLKSYRVEEKTVGKRDYDLIGRGKDGRYGMKYNAPDLEEGASAIEAPQQVDPNISLTEKAAAAPAVNPGAPAKKTVTPKAKPATPPSAEKKIEPDTRKDAPKKVAEIRPKVEAKSETPEQRQVRWGKDFPTIADKLIAIAYPKDDTINEKDIESIGREFKKSLEGDEQADSSLRQKLATELQRTDIAGTTWKQLLVAHLRGIVSKYEKVKKQESERQKTKERNDKINQAHSDFKTKVLDTALGAGAINPGHKETMEKILKDLDSATQAEVAGNMLKILNGAKTKEGKPLTDGFDIKNWLKSEYIDKKK